jgi:osmotically-inducible protein OsmY
MTNDELSVSVTAELFSDPKVNSQTIAVAADDGTVTLRGTVGSFRQKREARKAAQRVNGVVFVNDQLDVRILDEHRREDAELRGDVLQALMLDAAVPTTVEATVKSGFVRLTGIVTWQYQREEAEFIAGNVRGVTGVGNEIRLASPTPEVGEVRDSVTKALQRTAAVEADEIEVDTLNGRVKLTGSVGSWWEHDAVLAAVWHIPGVTDVDDRLSVRY